MEKTNELYYTISLHDGILGITLVNSTFWNNIHLFETYDETYIHMNFVTNHYFQSFGNMNNTKKHVVFYHHQQERH